MNRQFVLLLILSVSICLIVSKPLARKVAKNPKLKRQISDLFNYNFNQYVPNTMNSGNTGMNNNGYNNNYNSYNGQQQQNFNSGSYNGNYNQQNTQNSQYNNYGGGLSGLLGTVGNYGNGNNKNQNGQNPNHNILTENNRYPDLELMGNTVFEHSLTTPSSLFNKDPNNPQNATTKTSTKKTTSEIPVMTIEPLQENFSKSFDPYFGMTTRAIPVTPQALWFSRYFDFTAPINAIPFSHYNNI
ncbi:unnamed protein product [Brachionus calyciflorus]|uniref:Uncharacterized protein n=1 Tax=Brachionus calyciflorus TaxID=104777 RepID=A0A814DUD7_9BILA|nr:unnamed protein product [Brachionus calyciflorus]